MISGRKLLEESDPLTKYYKHPDMVQRRKVLKETINAFRGTDPRDFYQHLAKENLRSWKDARKEINTTGKVQVLQGDWGDVAQKLTREYGECFTVLNMANAYVPGGGYVEGMSAQEENMFRRTDCHFYITSEEYDRTLNQYRPYMTELISGKNGEVYLDAKQPRVCIRGRENRSRSDLGYVWLKEDETFPFYELRAAAQDLRGEKKFNTNEARKRIIAQLDTLRAKNIRYVVLGAFGCGAFLNPSDKIALLYRGEIIRRIDDFELIVFAIFSAGYGSGNYTPFAKALKA